MNSRQSDDDLYLQALQRLERTVNEHYQTSNDRFSALERKLDTLLALYTPHPDLQVQRDENLRLFRRNNELISGELSSDSGHGSTPSAEVSQSLMNGHVSEEEQSTLILKHATPHSSAKTPTKETLHKSSQDASRESITQKSSTRRDLRSEEKIVEQNTEPLAAKIRTNQVPYSTEVNTDSEDEEEFASTITQKTVIEQQHTMVQEQQEHQSLRENGNFELLKPGRRSISPLPSRSERPQVPYSKFKKLKTRASEDNRAKYFEQEYDVTYKEDLQESRTEASKSASQHTLVSEANTQQQPNSELNSRLLSGLQSNNRQLSETGLKNEHEDDNRFVREAHLPNDDFLNRIKRKDWKKNLEIFRSGSVQNEIEAIESEDPDSANNASVNEKQGSQVEKIEKSPEPSTGTAFIQQILSQQQLEASENEDVKAADGLDTIICIDTSASMVGLPLKTAKKQLLAFIDGVETAAVEYELEENIAVVTFGKENKTIQHLTNDYDLVRECIENLETGGASPLWLGLALSLTEIAARGSVINLNNRRLPPRIILVTDGFATSMDCLDVPEKTEPDKQVDETIAALIGMNPENVNTISPIIVTSNFNEESLTRIASMTNGSVIMDPSQIEQLHEYFRMQRTLDDVLTKCGNKKVTLKKLQAEIMNTPGLSETSASEIIEIIKRDTDIIEEEDEINIDSTEHARLEKLNFDIRSSWSRVRVIPNWSGDKSRSDMVGTVISSRKKGKVKVLWDDGIQENAKFGDGDVYDVHVVDEPRLLEADEEIAIGILVVRGPDWRWKNQDGGQGSIGVVTKIENGNVAHVVWPDGKLGNYRFGYSGKYDIQVCPNQRKPKHVIWEYRESSGGPWGVFPQDFREEIERLYQIDPTGKHDLMTNDTVHGLDLQSLSITDEKKSGLLWNLRRKELTEEEWRKLMHEQ